METRLVFQSAAQVKHSVGAFLIKKIKWIFHEVVFFLHKEKVSLFHINVNIKKKCLTKPYLLF